MDEARDSESVIHGAEPRTNDNSGTGEPEKLDLSAADNTTNTARSSTSQSHHQSLLLGQRPPLFNARRLTIHGGASSSRPSLLTKQLSFKSSSAVPTLSTLQVAATSTVSSSIIQPAISSRTRRANSGSGLTTPTRHNGTMAASATHLLKQAISHR
jgi:hypothetical protein